MIDVEFNKLSMDALVQKQDILHARLAFAYKAGSAGLIDGLSHALNAINSELNYRFALENARAVVEATSTIIETDPDLAALHKKQVDTVDNNEVPQEQRRRNNFRRSDSPLRPEDLK